MKKSFRDLLNFRAIEPIVDHEVKLPESTEKLVKPEDNLNLPESTYKKVNVAPNDFVRKRAAHVGVKSAGYTQKQLDEMNNWWGLVNTDAGKLAKAVQADLTYLTYLYGDVKQLGKNIKNKKANPLGGKVGEDINSAYGFIKEIIDDPLGNRWHKAVLNDREETLIAAIRKHVNSFKTDYNLVKSNPFKNTTGVLRDLKVIKGNDKNLVENSIWDPYTTKDYTERNVTILNKKETNLLKSSAMPMASTDDLKMIGRQVKKSVVNQYDKLKSALTGGTVLYTAEEVRNAILEAPEERLGQCINEFTKNELLYREMQDEYNEGMGRYYQTFSSPYGAEIDLKNPADALRNAKELGFCSGYKDLYGFSLDSSHLWGITIEPYEFDGIYKSLAPPLPAYKVPVWGGILESGDLNWSVKTLDYGKTPPVVSYSLNIGTSMEKDINLYNGSTIKIPMGFSYNYSLTITFADDQHSSIKNYMNYYYNIIHRPTEGLMAPYELCSFLITITSFKPGLKLKNMLKLICVPVGYSVTQSGESNPSNENVTVGFSVVGMKTSQFWESKVDKSLGGIWSKLTWNDVILRPVINRAITAPPDNWITDKKYTYNAELVGRDKYMKTSLEVSPIDVKHGPAPEFEEGTFTERRLNRKLQRLDRKGKADKRREVALKAQNKLKK